MEIKRNTERFYTTFEELKEGAVFKISDENNNIFMKVDEEQGVCLNDPGIDYFDEKDKVREIRAELQLMED